MEYLVNRGVKAETIAKWRIGFAPGPPKGGWREVKENLEAKGFKKDELLKAGLIKTTEGGKEPFDVFRDRIMFPMSEPSGKVVAFSGRILHPDDKAPKYVNSPDTELYKKSELLYGYDKAKTGIRNLDFSLIVEGQFDVVMCHQAGYGNTVAVSGTALTLNHVQLLERMSQKVVLALDADRAGINAMKKGADLMLRRGLDVKVAELPSGKDPADIIKENPTNFKKFIGKSVHVIEFLLHVLRREISDDRSFKLKVREEVLPFVLLLPSRIDQEHFVKIIAEAIDSTNEAVRFELDRLREKQATEVLKEEGHNYLNDDYNHSNKTVVNQDNGDKAYLFLLAASMLLDSKMAKIINIEVEKLLSISSLEKPAESELAKTVFILEQQFSTTPKLAIQEEVVSKLNRLRTLLVRSKLIEYKQQLVELESNHDDKMFAELLKEIGIYEAELRKEAYHVDMFNGVKD
jgi:DNA primase